MKLSIICVYPKLSRSVVIKDNNTYALGIAGKDMRRKYAIIQWAKAVIKSGDFKKLKNHLSYVKEEEENAA